MTQQPSICIPKVSKDISKKFIYNVFNNLQFGSIKNIDIVYYNKSRNYNFTRVFIHFNKWYTDIPIIKFIISVSLLKILSLFETK